MGGRRVRRGGSSSGVVLATAPERVAARCTYRSVRRARRHLAGQLGSDLRGASAGESGHTEPGPRHAVPRAETARVVAVVRPLSARHVTFRPASCTRPPRSARRPPDLACGRNRRPACCSVPDRVSRCSTSMQSLPVPSAASCPASPLVPRLRTSDVARRDGPARDRPDVSRPRLAGAEPQHPSGTGRAHVPRRGHRTLPTEGHTAAPGPPAAVRCHNRCRLRAEGDRLARTPRGRCSSRCPGRQVCGSALGWQLTRQLRHPHRPHGTGAPRAAQCVVAEPRRVPPWALPALDASGQSVAGPLARRRGEPRSPGGDCLARRGSARDGRVLGPPPPA